MLFSQSRRLARSLRRRLRDWWRGESDATFFDIHNLRAVNAILTGNGHPPLSAIPPPTDDPIVQQGRRGKRILELREDLRLAFPFGQTPHPERALFLTWLVTHGVSDFGLTPTEAVCYLLERDREPDRGLVATYLLRPDWQEAVPHALTAAGWPEFKNFLRASYGLKGRWFENARLDPSREQPPISEAPGVNVLAHFRYAAGVQEAALAVVKGLTEAGIPTRRRDLPVMFPCDWRDTERYQDLETFPTTLFIAAVNTFPSRWYPLCGLRQRSDVYRIALWYWELEELPADWLPELHWPSEVWAPTRFIADAFRKSLPMPVVPMLPGLSLPTILPKPRREFGLPDDRFLFVFSFDMGSVMERKNPLGVIAAFQRAFRPDDRVHLAVKVSRGDWNKPALAALQSATADDSRVSLINQVMTREDAYSFLACADCYVSLHRSEGLGLGMAECMAMGKPVIGTGYSGNLDFMNNDVSHLVNYDRVEIPPGFDPYPAGSHWAEPHLNHAAHLMRQVYTNPEAARELGTRAQIHVSTLLDPSAAAKRMTDRLTILGNT